MISVTGYFDGRCSHVHIHVRRTPIADIPQVETCCTIPLHWVGAYQHNNYRIRIAAKKPHVVGDYCKAFDFAINDWQKLKLTHIFDYIL